MTKNPQDSAPSFSQEAVSGLVPVADIEAVLKFKDQLQNTMQPEEVREKVVACRDNIDRSYFLMLGLS